MKKLLFLIIFLSPSFCFSQTWFQDGDTWVYKQNSGFHVDLQTFTVVGDTIIGNQACKKFLTETMTTSAFSPDTSHYQGMFFAYEKTDSLYRWDSYFQDFQLIADWTLVQNDTIDYDPFLGLVKLNDLDSILLGGNWYAQREELFEVVSCEAIGNEDSLYFSSIERIGMVSGVRSSFVPGYLNSCLIDNTASFLCKFESNDFSYEPSYPFDCYSLPVGQTPLNNNNPIVDSNVQVFPNPSSGSVSFKNLPMDQAFNVSVFNIQGKLLQKQDLIGQNFDFENFIQPGLYYLKLETKTGDSHTFKVVRQ